MFLCYSPAVLAAEEEERTSRYVFLFYECHITVRVSSFADNRHCNGESHAHSPQLEQGPRIPRYQIGLEKF